MKNGHGIPDGKMVQEELLETRMVSTLDKVVVSEELQTFVKTHLIYTLVFASLCYT